MRAESAVANAWATELSERIVRQAITDLEEMPYDCPLPGEDCGLESMWEEICVQVQGEPSYEWDVYVETMETIVGGLIEELPRSARLALWLKTDQGCDWLHDHRDDERGEDAAPLCNDEITAVLMSGLLEKARDFQNDRISRYLSGDKEDEGEEDHDVSSPTATNPDFLIITASKEEVLAGNTTSVLKALRPLISSPETALRWREKVDFAIDGYNDVQWELFEIPEVRNFVASIDAHFPFWLFFLSKHALGLQCVAYCFLPPFLKPEARASIFPERLDDLLSRRWFPAMNQICDWVGLSEEEIEAMSKRAVEYLLAGPNQSR
jgi:hypothetical protein